MFKFRLETEINKPIEEVIRLFADRQHLPTWQQGLVSSELLESSPNPKYKLVFKFGRRNMVMTETILRNELPSHFDGTYVMKGVTNHIHNSFTSTQDGATKWMCETEFQFKGLMNLVATFMRSDFLKQSNMVMENFKRFAETYRG